MGIWSLLQQPLVMVAARSLVGATLLVAAARKLPHRQQFVFVVVAYRVLPRSVAGFYAKVLPWIEATVGATLLAGLATRVAATASLLLLASFTFAIGLNMARGRQDFDCGCFGGGTSHTAPLGALGRNAILMLLSAQLILAANPAVDGVMVSVVNLPVLSIGATVGILLLLFFLLLPLLRQATALRLRGRDRRHTNSAETHGR